MVEQLASHIAVHWLGAGKTPCLRQACDILVNPVCHCAMITQGQVFGFNPTRKVDLGSPKCHLKSENDVIK